MNHRIIFCLLIFFSFADLFAQSTAFDLQQINFEKTHLVKTQTNKKTIVYSNQNNGLSPDAPKSGGKAGNIFLSMLLPGAGEWAMGHKSAAKIFLGSEIALWLGYLGNQSYVGILQDDLEAFAALHAGVNSAGKGDQYWIDVGIANNLSSFNSDRLLERDIDATYAETPENQWQWDSEDNRRAFVSKRFKRLDWKRRGNFIVGTIVLNHIVSAVDVIRLIRKDRSHSQARHSKMQIKYANNINIGETYLLDFTWHW